MLVRNPITAFLYTFGYNGIENIHEYWTDNKEAIIKSYRKTRKAKYDKKDLVAFRYKVRWGSSFGLFLRMGIDRLIRTTSEGPMDFQRVKVRYGKKYLGIEDFSMRTMKDDSGVGAVDLRGISILRKHMENVSLEGIDFSYAAFDGCDFINVTFSGCHFKGTSFRGTRIIGCKFLDNNILSDNDFTGALIDSSFMCQVTKPNIAYRSLWTIKGVPAKKVPKYHKHTLILSKSFAEQCGSEKVSRYSAVHRRNSKGYV